MTPDTVGITGFLPNITSDLAVALETQLQGNETLTKFQGRSTGRSASVDEELCRLLSSVDIAQV